MKHNTVLIIYIIAIVILAIFIHWAFGLMLLIIGGTSEK